MILVDTAVWIDHLQGGNAVLAELLSAAAVLIHPFVIGELALVGLRARDSVLRLLRRLPQTIVAKDQEVLHFIDRQALVGSGIGYVDAHLLASTRLTAGASLWTRDKRLLSVAARLGLAADPTH